MDPMSHNPRRKLLRRKDQLWQKRSQMLQVWREISEFTQPLMGRFLLTEKDRLPSKPNKNYDSTAYQSSNILAAGLMSGATSPARPWFRLALEDKDLMKHGSVKLWLHKTTELMLMIFSKSNTYNSLHVGYRELGVFGTWANIIVPNYENVIHHYPLTIGEYAIATDHLGRSSTLAREYRMTVEQVVMQFGLANCSQTIKNLWDNCAYDQELDVVHMIQPRAKRDASRPDNKNMPFESVYIECGRDDWDKYLSESGFKRFPAVCPRWDVNSNNVYGTGPGLYVLGDVKSLHHKQMRKSQVIDYQVRPPLQMPTMLRNQPGSTLPGGVTYVDSTGPQNSIHSMWDVETNLQHLMLDVQDTREMIRNGFHVNLFLMLQQDVKGQMTATEVAERHEEKMVVLGPTIERQHTELQGPLIDITFDYMVDAGILPPPPPEIQDQELSVEFISILAQAMKAVTGRSVDRFIGTVGQIAAAKADPGVWDKVMVEETIDYYGDMLGVPPNLIRPTDEAQKIAEQRNQQMQAMQAAQSAGDIAGAAKTASEIDTQGMGDVMSALTGYTTPAQ